LNKKDRSLVTAKLALGIARLKDLSKDDCDLIYKGALAHDAGYLMLDPSELKRIISTPEINEDEWKYIQSHVTHGLDYFGEAEIPELIRDAILHHHERNDGTGYPNGLHKCDIPLVAQIVGISETFASLLSNRSYRDKVEFGHAMAIIKDGARRKFDPDLVTILEQVVKASGGSL
jgi:HD-GYP domain-containing protein (c-di-GMP phosphodiesterase class II)